MFHYFFLTRLTILKISHSITFYDHFSDLHQSFPADKLSRFNHADSSSVLVFQIPIVLDEGRKLVVR